MYYTITPEAMRNLEKSYMDAGLVSGEALMERAAAYVADAIIPYLDEINKTVICLCGPGNNGGDALCAMGLLHKKGVSFNAIAFVLDGNQSADFIREKNKLLKIQAPVEFIHYDGQVIELAKQSAVIVDAMFGTGLSRQLTGKPAMLCQFANECNEQGLPIISVDIPSGLCGRTGHVLGISVKATKTLCFHQMKPGLLLNDGIDYAGEVTVCDIGLPIEKGYEVLVRDDVKTFFPKRKRNTHKGSYGKVVLFVGSFGMAGAAALAATSALRSGAGLVCIACPERIVDTIQVLCPCAVCKPLPADVLQASNILKNEVQQANALVVGCGLSQNEWATEMIKILCSYLKEQPKPTIWDADGLNIMAKLKMKFPPMSTISPHPMEASRLLNWKLSEVLSDPEKAILQLQSETDANIILKGACSLLCSKDGFAINPFGTSAMAKAGSGDVLSGILGALTAGKQIYGFSELKILQLACALHGLAGEAVVEKQAEQSLLATELCDNISQVLY